MAHHKRHRTKNRRAGCRLCKQHKANGFSRRKRMRAGFRRKCQDVVRVDDGAVTVTAEQHSPSAM